MGSSSRAIAFLLATLALCGAVSFAHPGETHEETVDHDFLRFSKRSLSSCADSAHAQALEKRHVERRAAMFEKLQAERGLKKRDLATVLATSHKSSLTGVTAATSAATLFGTTAACILQQEVTVGPYYVTGEYFRSDIRDGQAGVDMYLDMQFIDVNTCTPVTGAYVDLWHTNPLGVYSGVVANGNGNDPANGNKTYNRGIMKTGTDGVVQFITTFPGHYSGRTTHLHLLLHAPTSVLINGTYIATTANATHVGQAFFDQDLINSVEALSPYSSNTQATVANSADNILFGATSGGFDPVIRYALLGATVADGLFGWISVGVDGKKVNTAQAAYVYDAVAGGVRASSSSSSGSGSGGSQPARNGSSTAGAGASQTAGSRSARGGSSATGAVASQTALTGTEASQTAASAATVTESTAVRSGAERMVGSFAAMIVVAIATVGLWL